MEDVQYNFVKDQLVKIVNSVYAELNIIANCKDLDYFGTDLLYGGQPVAYLDSFWMPDVKEIQDIEFEEYSFQIRLDLELDNAHNITNIEELKNIILWGSFSSIITVVDRINGITLDLEYLSYENYISSPDKLKHLDELFNKQIINNTDSDLVKKGNLTLKEFLSLIS